MLQLLFHKGADVNAVDNADETPLHYAARFGNSTAAKLLLPQPGILVEVRITNILASIKLNMFL